MPVTFILLLIYGAAIVLAVIGATKKTKTLKIISAVIFLIGVDLTIAVALAQKNM